MENKDQLNQIPEESKNETQDEKTSKQETKNIEAAQQVEEQLEKKQAVTEETVQAIEEEAVAETSSVEIVEEAVEEKVAETPVNEIVEEAVAETPVEETVEAVEEKVVVETPAEETAQAIEEEAVAETPSVEIIEEAVEEKVAETLVEEVVAETPVEETVEAIEEKVVVETPAEETARAIEEEAVVETSAEEIVVEAPEEKVAETPVEEVEEEAVAETPVENTVEAVEEKAVVETPAEETAQAIEEEAVVESPVDDIVVESIEEKVAETPVEEVVEEAVAETPIEETVAETPAAEEVKETPVKETVEAAEVKVATETVGELDDAVTSDEDDDHDDHDDEPHEEDGEAEKVDINEMSRDELIVALEALVQAEDVNKIKAKIALIKVAYLKKSKEEKEERYQHFLSEGGDKEDYHPADDPLQEKFNHLFDIYKQKRGIFLENLEKEKIENLAKKKTILEELKQLINSEETLKKTYDDFRALQDSWKVTGMVPKSEVNNLWQNYHFLVEMFFDKVKINKELKDLDLKKNLEQKIVLCEKAEELLLETSILKSFKELQRLHEQWKEIGPAPDDKREEIWDRFKSATEKINIRRREHYKKLQDEQENNLLAKTALCEKAESLTTAEVDSIREWQNMTKQFNDLFKVWKTVGPAPKKQNDEIWERFKTALDGFFTEKKEYFGKLKDQQVNNYNIKLDLCVQAEAMKDSTDWRNATRDLINMQKEWREVGPVPRKHSDKIWKRFRSACDEFFNRKSEYFSNIKEEEATNLKKKEDLIKQVEEYKFDGNKSDNLNLLKDFQRQWTEIGFVPFKEKDRLQNAFRDTINKQLDKLNISNVEMSMSNYKSRFEVIKDSPDGDRQIYRERTFVQNKIAKMQEDILLWENNLGFLANSKKADLLKAEFEKKIEAAKKEVAELQVKIKFLNK